MSFTPADKPGFVFFKDAPLYPGQNGGATKQEDIPAPAELALPVKSVSPESTLPAPAPSLESGAKINVDTENLSQASATGVPRNIYPPPFSLADESSSKREPVRLDLAEPHAGMGLEFNVNGTMGSKILLQGDLQSPTKHPNTNTKVSLSHPKGMYDNLVLDGTPPAPVEDQLGPSDAEQVEDMVMLYIKLLDPADKYFLQYQTIYDNGEQYIAYLKSPEYLQYRKAKRTFDVKYSNNKKFSVMVVKKKITAFTRDKSGQPGSQIDSLTRPTYINIVDVLEKTHKSLKQTRIKLDNVYGRLLDKPFISQQAKATFIKNRESLITKLNEFYALQYYYQKINGLNQTNTLVTLPKVFNYYSENAQELQPRIITKEVSISQDDIMQQRANATNKLELYNKIKAGMLDSKRDAPMSKELKDLVQSYITFDESNSKELDSLIDKKKKHIQLEYLVVPPGLEMPDNSLIKPRDLRPFYASKKSASLASKIN